MYKISITTVCMNRLSFLCKTLPVSIAENVGYPNLEFVVLDYNSQDGMEAWARKNLSKYIEAGILRYYKNDVPQYFDLSHSKNMVAKLATGDIICQVDADNYAGPNYAAWVNEIFSRHGRDTIITTLRKNHIPFRDQGGKICVSKHLFSSVLGYDESLVGYGIDDVDLVNRLEKAGGKRFFIEDEKYLKFIGHSDVERLKNHHLVNNLENIFVQMSASMETHNRVLYLLKDKGFIELNLEFNAALKSNLVLSYAGWRIRNGGRLKGVFDRTSDGYFLTYSNGSTVVFREEGTEVLTSGMNHGKEQWKKIRRDNEMFYALVMAYGECVNRLKYVENDKDSNAVNPDGWGKGSVHLNFDRSNPITI